MRYMVARIHNAQNRPLSNEAAAACKADHRPAAECTSGRSNIIILSYRLVRLNQRVIITQNIGALPDRTTSLRLPPSTAVIYRVAPITMYIRV